MKCIELQINYDDVSKETAEVYVEVKIQGQTCQFLLDTACAKTSLNFDDFSSRFEKYGSQESSGIFGRTEYDLISIDWIDVGDMITKNNIVLSRAKKGELDRKLLGMDILKDYCLLFFFAKEKLEMRLKPDKNISTHNLILDKGFIPHIKLECCDSVCLATWDSGASVTLVDTSFIERHPTMFEQIEAGVGTDSTGSKIETPMYIMSSIFLGDQKFPPHKVAGVNLSHIKSVSNISMDFILGFSTLRHADWLFDFPQKKWAILKMISE
jgi:hypothetical protein